MTAPPSTAADVHLGRCIPGAWPAVPRAARARRGLRWLARSAWRQLTSMRTALLLLFLLAIAAIPGPLLPQRGVNPLEVDSFIAGHPALGPFFDRLSLFDVFAAPWFGAIYALLFVLARRVRSAPDAAVRPRAGVAAPAGARPPVPGSSTARPTLTTAEPEVAIGKAGPLLRRRRVARGDRRARPCRRRRARLREAGNLLFHTSLLLLLVGVGAGRCLRLLRNGARRRRVLVHEQSDQLRPVHLGTPGRPGGLPPFSLKLTSFDASYQPDGTPRTFMAHVAARTDLAGAATPGDIAVNAPWRDGSAKVYLIGHGYAPALHRAGRVRAGLVRPVRPLHATGRELHLDVHGQSAGHGAAGCGPEQRAPSSSHSRVSSSRRPGSTRARDTCPPTRRCRHRG